MTHNRRSVVHGLAVRGALVLAFVGCEKQTRSAKTPATPPKDTVAPAAPAAHAVYGVAGRVTQVPDPKNPTTECRVRHERIPDFKNAKGEVIGMNEMEMPFPIGDGTHLVEGIAVGDLVEITFGVWNQPYFSHK